MNAYFGSRVAICVSLVFFLASCSGSTGSRDTIPVTPPLAPTGPTTSSSAYHPQYTVYPVPLECPASNPQTPGAFAPLAVNASGTQMWWLDQSRGTYELSNGTVQGCLPALTFTTQNGTTIYGGNRMAYGTNGIFYTLAVDSAGTEYYLVSNALNPSSALITPIEPGSAIQQAFDIEVTPTDSVVFGQNTSLIVVNNASTHPQVHSYTLPDNADCTAAITTSENGDLYVGTCGSPNYIFKYSPQMSLLAAVPIPATVESGAIAPDPAGGVWFVPDTSYSGGNAYGYVSANGSLKMYSTPAGVTVSAVATARDGSVWLAGQTQTGAVIAQINTSDGQLTLYDLPANVVTPAVYLRGTYNDPSCSVDALYLLNFEDQIVSIML